MALKMKSIFVNLAVKNLSKSKQFFTDVGFSFDERFCDDNGCCLVLGDNFFAMLLSEPFFQSFTQQGITDTTQENEVILAVMVPDKAEVDQIRERWLQAGGMDVSTPLRPEEQDFLYYYRLQDLDGHLWEITYMEPFE